MAKITIGCAHEHCATIGGGTVHLFKFLEWLAPYYDVDIIFPNNNIPSDQWYKDNMDIDLSHINKITLDKANLQDYEIWINGWASKIMDNPYAKTKINIVWFPFLPQLAEQAQKFINIGNSKYTEKYIREIWKVKKENSLYIYPPTSLKRFKAAKIKNNWITHVSRFMPPDPASDKGHMQMIETFKKMIDKGLKDWEFHLIGMLLSERKDVMPYYTELLETAQGYPIFFHTNVTMDEMAILQSKAKIYWHATGIKLKNPAAQEHFGLSVLEGMAAGAVPVTYNSGGQPEIVKNGKNGFLYDDLDSLQSKTMDLINDPLLLGKLRTEAGKVSEKFSEEKSKQAWLDFVSRTHKVSIVIGTTYNTLLFEKCITRLLECTPPGYELIIIDNAADIETKAFIKAIRYKNLKVIHNKKIKGYGEFNNQGLKVATRPYLCFLNDDTEPNYYWLEAMIDVMENDSKVGVVGAKLLFPDGTIQHDGKKFGPGGVFYHINHHKADDGNWKTAEVEGVTGACMMVRCELAHFDERYKKGYFEDDQLQLDAMRKGYKIMLVRNSPIIHHEGSSMAKDIKETEQAYRKNRALFLRLNKNFISKLLETKGINMMKTNKIQKIRKDEEINLSHLTPEEANTRIKELFLVMKKDEQIILNGVDMNDVCQKWLQTFEDKYIERIFGKEERNVWGWSFQKAYDMLMGIGFRQVGRTYPQNIQEGFFYIRGIKP